MQASRCVMGIWVGGQARRMGGVQKALLSLPDSEETLVARLTRLGRDAGLEVVLVGTAELGAAASDVLQLPDTHVGIGPLAGLSSLLSYAAERAALAVACDMPFVTAALLARLIHEAPDATLLAARDEATGKWQSLFARYASARVRPALQAALARKEHSFQALFERVPVDELRLTAAEHAQLRDWDTPEDMLPR
jgi:molybdopterin-guanine dinucleotide biosynthesis protein A